MELHHANMESWADLDFWNGPTFPKIVKFLAEERMVGKSILPPKDFVFRAYQLTPFSETKVVILGQDPYPTVGHAMGLAFSVTSTTRPLPKSLQNVFKELEDDIGVKRTNGDLTDWAEQGVLLLNTSLTVVEGVPASHSNIGWSALTSQTIRALSEHKEHVVFILWGKHAQQKGMIIDRNKHLVIESAHPSPLSAYTGFFGSECFSKTNAYLNRNNITTIHW